MFPCVRSKRFKKLLVRLFRRLAALFREIQAASGEWMNEFVRPPDARRDDRALLPTVDIIKRTIRRSWTISNPTPRWSAMRASPDMRPYNSLPRRRDVADYPTLALHRGVGVETTTTSPTASGRRRSPRRTQSEEMYDERGGGGGGGSPIRLGAATARRRSPKMMMMMMMNNADACSSEEGSSKEEDSPKAKRMLTPDALRKYDRFQAEKHVSFDSTASNARHAVLSENRPSTNRIPARRRQEDCSNSSEELTTVQHDVQPGESSSPVETCDIEPFSGTVFRKMMVRKRRQRASNGAGVAADTDEAGVVEAHSSPMLASSTPKTAPKSAKLSPAASSAGVRRTASKASQDWHNDDDFERLGHARSSLSTLGARSDSMASVYSGAGEGRYGTVAVRGQVEFGLQYDYKAGDLEIQIKQCKDLAPVDTKRNRSDPYVKVYLLPDKSKSGKRKTKVKKHTLNPAFDECLKFHTSLADLETRTLWLTVWHSDMFGRNDFLGEVAMTLENKVFDDPTPRWYQLQERTEPFEEVPTYRGDVIVCLKFVPPDMTLPKKGKRSRGALHVLVKEAKALSAVKANGTSDPFCKSYLLPDKGRSSKQKTPVAKRSVNPVWNHTFVYDDVTLQELSERCLELTVWDHDRLASNEFLGGVRFSLGTGKHHGKPADWMDSSGRELSLWKDMLEKPNFWVEGALSLRSTLETRCS